MIINNESIINSLKTKDLDKRDLYYVEATITIIKFIEIHYKKLFDFLSKQQNIANQEIIMEVWGIIDNFRKLECILNQLPGLKKKDPQIQLYLRKINVCEEPRHFIEHYNKEIDSLNNKTLPPLGHLSFALLIDNKNVQSFAIIPGYIRTFKGLQIVNPVGKKFMMNIDLVTYYIGSQEVNLSDLLYSTQKFILEFEKYIQKRMRKNSAK